MRNVSLVCWMHLHAKSLWNASRNRNANAIYTSRLGVFNLLTWFAFASTQYQNCVSLCTVQSLLFCRSASSRNWTLPAFIVACRIWGKTDSVSSSALRCCCFFTWVHTDSFRSLQITFKYQYIPYHNSQLVRSLRSSITWNRCEKRLWVLQFNLVWRESSVS